MTPPTHGVQLAIVTLLALMCASPVLAAEPAAKIRVAAKMDGTTGEHVPEAVEKECSSLGTVVPGLLAKGNKDVSVVPDLGDKTQGRVLELKITEVLAHGGGVYSGPKKITIEGKLSKGGEPVGSFTARRGSMKRSRTCKLLVAVEKGLSKDILKWLKEPTMDAKIGKAK